MLRDRNTQWNLLAEVLEHLFFSDDQGRIVRDLFPKVAAHFGVDTYFNYMIAADGRLRLHSCAGVSEETARAIEYLQLGEGICGTVAQTRTPIVATDILNSNYDKAALVRSFGIQAYACNPLSRGERLLGTLSFASRTRTHFEEYELGFMRRVSRYAAVAMERAETVRRNEAWLSGQKAAFQAAMDGAPLETSLGILVRTAMERADSERRCAFYITDADGKELRHVVGMPESYARCVDGFAISPESLACGLAVSTGRAIITRDVLEEPRWTPWRWLAREYDYRSCWSFPIETSTGKAVGSFAVYFKEPREAAASDLEFATALTQAASIIISRYQETEERKRAEEARRLLLNELQHRVKNTFASVQAIAQHTLHSTKTPEDFAATFFGRLQSLARAHSILSAAQWQGADLREVIRDQLSLATDETRVAAVGTTAHLEPQMALHLALMLHELGTNSRKYGALSKPEGNVTVGWTIAEKELRLSWNERGGPPVEAPSRRGFGMTLIEQSAAGEGGSARMTIEPHGVAWEITLPLPHRARAIRAPTSKHLGRSMPTQDAPEQDQPPGSLAGKRLLVVEDEALVALDVAAGLKQAGADVCGPVATSKDALRIIETTQLDGALLDANLHGSPVSDIAAALTCRKVPFVFVTGYGRDVLPDPFGDAPMLAKPFRREQLLDAAAQLVCKR